MDVPDVPLDHEAATADLITDIVASSLHGRLPDSEVCDLARSVVAESPGWRDAWSLHPEVPQVETRDAPSYDPTFDTFVAEQGLSREEDDELRHLFWLSQIGTLVGRKAERLLELRFRDRRRDIRPPRDEEGVWVGGVRRRWFRFRNR